MLNIKESNTKVNLKKIACQAKVEMSYCYQSRNVLFWARGSEGPVEMEGARRATGISTGDSLAADLGIFGRAP